MNDNAEPLSEDSIPDLGVTWGYYATFDNATNSVRKATEPLSLERPAELMRSIWFDSQRYYGFSQGQTNPYDKYGWPRIDGYRAADPSEIPSPDTVWFIIAKSGSFIDYRPFTGSSALTSTLIRLGASALERNGSEFLKNYACYTPVERHATWGYNTVITHRKPKRERSHVFSVPLPLP